MQLKTWKMNYNINHNIESILQKIQELDASINDRKKLILESNRLPKSIWHHKNIIQIELNEIKKLKQLLTQMEK